MRMKSTGTTARPSPQGPQPGEVHRDTAWPSPHRDHGWEVHRDRGREKSTRITDISAVILHVAASLHIAADRQRGKRRKEKKNEVKRSTGTAK